LPFPSARRGDLVQDQPLRRGRDELKLKLSARKQALLVQGGPRQAVDIFRSSRLAGSTSASQAVVAGGGRWAMMLWFKAPDYAKASSLEAA
jgi:hypothetical protein